MTLQDIAEDATARGWPISWADTDARTELLIEPTLSNAEHQGMLGLGFGNLLGNSGIACWVWEAWSSSLIEPDVQPRQEVCISREAELFPKVSCLEEALPIFDKAAARYMAAMRQFDLEHLDGDGSSWAGLEPLAAQSRVNNQPTY